MSEKSPMLMLTGRSYPGWPNGETRIIRPGEPLPASKGPASAGTPNLLVVNWSVLPVASACSTG